MKVQTPEQAQKAADRIRRGKTIDIPVKDQREMCHIKKLLQDAGVEFVRQGEPTPTRRL